MKIHAANWIDPIPRVVFEPGVYSEKPFLAIKNVRSQVSDSLSKALQIQNQLEYDQTEQEIKQKGKALKSLLKEAKETFFVMGGEGYGYPSNFSSTSKPKRKDRNTEDQFFETKDVVVEEKVVATIALDKLLQDVMENEISQCVVVHSADTNSLFYSSEPRLISPTRKFECEKGDSITTRFGINIFNGK